MDLTAFLSARLDEDEAAARACDPADWYNADAFAFAFADADGGDRPTAKHDADGVHAARHSPARVLAEVAAKRAVLSEWRYRATRDMGSSGTDPADQGWVLGLHHTLAVLARPYSDHPDFDPAWRA